MKIYIVGIACVGKTTIGRLLADHLNYSFFDLALEVEKYYEKPIEMIQNECFSMNGFREKESIVLDKLLKMPENAVISGTPSGLRNSMLRVYKKHKKRIDLISVNIVDNPMNILERLTFYDRNSNLIEIKLNESDKKKYLRMIKGDMNYFKTSLSRADLQINIENVSLTLIPELIVNELNKFKNNGSILK